MKIDDLIKIENKRKKYLQKVNNLIPEISKLVNDLYPNVIVIKIKPVGAITDKKIFREESTVSIGIYIKSNDYDSGMNKSLTKKIQDAYDNIYNFKINIVVFVLENKNVLNELKRYGYVSDYEGKRIILAPNGNVFIFDDENIDDINQDLLDQYNIDVDGIIDNEESKFIKGIIRDNKLVIAEYHETDLTSILATSIKKLIKEFNLDGVEYEAYVSGDYEYEENVTRDDVLNATLKNANMYHGTNSVYIMNILKKGIMPTRHTNFSKIFHEDKIFFTSKLYYSMFHAFNSASKKGGIPLIVKFKIPDPSKVVLDYDIAINYYGIDHPLTKKLGYDIVNQNSREGRPYYGQYDKSDMENWKKLADKASLNTRAGIFGYTGRIPASYITEIYVDPNSIPLIAEYLYYGEFDNDSYENPQPQDMKPMTVNDFKKEIMEIIEEMKSYDEDEDY